LLAQCAAGASCELPTGLPWYFGLAVAVVWLGAVVGAVLLGRRLLVRRFSARRRAGEEARALEQRTSSTDVELW
jgi:hypothetical protein